MSADRKEELLELALELWLCRGHQGWSYADLARGTGIRKASVHHHFATKGDLVEELITRNRRQFAGFAATMEGMPAHAAVDTFLRGYAGLLDRGDGICPAGAISADVGVLPPGALAAGRRYLGDQQAWLVATLQRGGWDGPEDLATATLSALQGALQRSRAQENPDLLHGTIRVLRRLLGVGAQPH